MRSQLRYAKMQLCGCKATRGRFQAQRSQRLTRARPAQGYVRGGLGCRYSPIITPDLIRGRAFACARSVNGGFREWRKRLLMSRSGWMAEGLLRDPQSVYSRQAFDHWAAIYGTSSALRDEFREGGLYPHKVRQLGSDISQVLLGKGLNRLASGSVLWSQV